jgi:hypothetical protein
MTTHSIDLPSTGRVVAYRAPITDHLFCAPCGQSDRSTAFTSDDLPDGGVCVGCGVDVLIPQEVAPESDDPRLALMSALNTPPYDGPSGKYCTPLGEAAQLLDAYQAAVLLEAAKALELRFGLTPATIELRLMSTNAQQAANA